MMKTDYLMIILCGRLDTKEVEHLSDTKNFRLVASSEPARPSVDFNKMRIDNKIYRDDVTLNTSFFDHRNRRKIKKHDVYRALERRELKELRAISNYFFLRSGIYSRLCRYMAYLYRYDWMITPIRYDDKIKDEKVIEGWLKSVAYLDNCALKKNFGEIALKVVKNGCFYGYKIQEKNACYFQELPIDYCRSRFKYNNNPIVEFNVKFFDDKFSDTEYRIRVLKMFPKEIQQAYIKYKHNTLKKDHNGDSLGWAALDAGAAFKFNLNHSDIPLFISIIPKLIDLEDAQDLDEKKREQQLIRLIIQEMPIDKNGDLIFDVDEARELHKNAVNMLGDTIGVDVLTTFADVHVEDLSDKGNESASDQLEKVERTVYNEAGVSQMQFNTSGNLALEKSIANDEATMTNLLLQFQEFAESLLSMFNKNPKRLKYQVQMLPTTIYNYKDLSKLYKEQTQIGFSKLLPQIALGESPSTVLATAVFENQMMKLDEIFTPPQMSSTISKTQQSGGGNGRQQQQQSEEPGRPELPQDEKSDKTIANEESQG